MLHRLRIGLTGGIASGKTTVADRFRERGVPVIDADEVARAVVAPGLPALSEIAVTFGAGVMTATGELNRRALRDVIFADSAKRKKLESILHPRIQAEMERRVALAIGPYVVMAIPLLIEGGNLDRIDRILVIDVDEAIQLQRVIARDSCSSDQARAILAAQSSRADRLAAADDVLENKGSVSDLRHAVDALHERYLQLASAAAPPKDNLT